MSVNVKLMRMEKKTGTFQSPQTLICFTTKCHHFNNCVFYPFTSEKEVKLIKLDNNLDGGMSNLIKTVVTGK